MCIKGFNLHSFTAFNKLKVPLILVLNVAIGSSKLVFGKLCAAK
jgi:hypothetical protein